MERGKGWAFLLLLLAAVSGGWFLRGVSDRSEPPGSTSASPAKPAGGSLPPATVLAVRPDRARAAAPLPSKLSATFQEHIASRNYAEEFARLSALKPRSPEEQWILARTLEYCGRVVDPEAQRAKTAIPMPNEDQARARFVESLSPDDPDRDKRIAAYDVVPRHRCDGVDAAPISREAWRALMQVAADGGEPKARVDLLEDDLTAQRRARSKANDARVAALAPAQLEGMKQAVASGDPYAIEKGVELITGFYPNFSLRDAQGQAVDMEALRSAGELTACDAGYRCDETNPSMAFECAFAGHCAATNYRDQTMYYKASPYTSQLIAQYELALRSAAANGDWSGFRFDPRPPTFAGTIR